MKQQVKIYSNRIELYDEDGLSCVGGNDINNPEDVAFRDNIQSKINSGELDLIYDESDPEPAKKYLKRLLAAKRYEVEVGGSVWNGLPVNTDRESQSKVIGAVVAISAGLRSDGDKWKFDNGEAVALTNTEMMAVAAVVAGHVQGSFNTEAAKIAEIDATGTTDLETGW